MASPVGTNIAHVPTKELRAVVKSNTAFGVQQELIAEQLEISIPTLRKHYAREISLGTANMVGAVAAELYRKAMNQAGGMPAVTAAIFILKARGQWRDQHQTVAHTGADGETLPGSTLVVPLQVYIPDNGRDPHLHKPVSEMKLIEATAIKALPRNRKAKIPA